MDLFWAAGVNGEGSSVVAFAFVKNLVYNQDESNVCIVYTSQSTLSLKLESLSPSAIDNLSSRNVQLLQLPKWCRLYPIHFLIKCCFPVNIFFKRCVVFDDFPFGLASRQLLYFHQPNLIFGTSPLWKIKRLVFVMLKSKSLIFNFQTHHIRDSFLRKFGDCTSLCLLHKI